MEPRAALAEQDQEVEDRLLVGARQAGRRVDRATVYEVRGDIDAPREREDVGHGAPCLAPGVAVGYAPRCGWRAPQASWRQWALPV